MISKISSLPVSLKVVTWLNIVSALLCAVSGISEMSAPATSQVWINLCSALLSGLVVVGILQKSRFVRGFVLICAWLATVLYVLVLGVAIMSGGLLGLVVLIPMMLSITTIWGLSTSETKAYFGIGLQPAIKA